MRAFFDEHFADAVPHLPRLVEEFRENPTSSLVYTACKPFHAGESVVLIGDAAHAIVPFYGQGMNAAFEDCTALDRILDEHEDVGEAVRAYTAERKPNADAIRDLALYNFIVMRERVADPAFLARRKLETTLEQAFPETYRSLYGMVTFSTVPYAEAQATADAQTAFLDADAGRVSAGLLALAHVRSLMSVAVAVAQLVQSRRCESGCMSHTLCPIEHRPGSRGARKLESPCRILDPYRRAMVRSVASPPAALMISTPHRAGGRRVRGCGHHGRRARGARGVRRHL